MKSISKRLALLFVLLLCAVQPAAAASDGVPKLKSIEASPGILNGDVMEYTIALSCGNSHVGIDHVSVQFKNLSNDNTANLVLRAADLADADTYRGVLSISTYRQRGTYTLNKVTIMNKEGKYHFYMRKEDLSEETDSDSKSKNQKSELPVKLTLDFSAGQSVEDKEAPVLNGFRVSKDRVQAETALEVFAEVTETGSGIDYVKARFVSDTGRGITVTLKSGESAYTGYLSGASLKHEGIYTLERVMLQDLAGNRRVYERGDGQLLQGVEFVVEP